MNTDSVLGVQLDEYRLEALLGQGGMARVYRAVDMRLRRYVAIKVIETRFRSDSDHIQRFEHEAQAIAQLDHPHIVRVYRFGEANGLLYIAMQFIQGLDLSMVLGGYRKDDDWIEPDDVRRIIREVCGALDYAHRQGVIHRDVKPSNIMLDRQGRAILTDFGLALLPGLYHQEVFGSPHYMSPEQVVSPTQVGPLSDLYSLGVVLFEIFTGQLPFNAPDPLAIAAMHVNDPPRRPREVRPSLPAEVEAVILRAMAKEPDERFPTGEALAGALDKALLGPRQKSAPVPPATMSRLSIPDRVALQAALSPLPVLPAAVAEPAAPEQPAPPGAATATRPRNWLINQPVRRNLRAWVPIALIVLIGLCGLAWLAQWAFAQLPTSIDRGTSTPTLAGSTATQPPASATRLAATATSVVVVVPTAAASPTALPPAAYTLMIVKGEEGAYLAVVNQTDRAFPLAGLRLGEGGDAITGAEWELAELGSGKCVTAWRNSDEENQDEAGLDCMVGQPLTREGKRRFWERTFDVYYQDEKQANCDRKQPVCTVEVVVSP